MKRPLFALCFPFHWLFCAFLPGFAFFVRSGQSRRDLRSRAFVKRDVTKLVRVLCVWSWGRARGDSSRLLRLLTSSILGIASRKRPVSRSVELKDDFTFAADLRAVPNNRSVLWIPAMPFTEEEDDGNLAPDTEVNDRE